MDKLSTRIINQYWDGLTPVKIEEICTQMGFLYEHTQDNQFACQLAYRNEQEVILFNPNETRVRQRLALALGMSMKTLGYREVYGQNIKLGRNAFKCISNVSSDRYVINFAIKILMPEYAVNQIIMKEKVRDVKQLSERFMVSEYVVQARLIQLGFLPACV